MSISLERLKEIEAEYESAWKKWNRIITPIHVNMLRDNQRVIRLLIKECETGEKLKHFKD